MDYLTLAVFVLAWAAFLGLAGNAFAQRRRLGRRLWVAPLRVALRTGVLAASYGVGAGLLLWASVRDPLLAMWSWMYVAMAVSVVGILLLESRFEVRERGIVAGLTVMEWGQVLGWGWRAGGKRSLQLWSSSPWRWFFQAKPEEPLSTGVAWSEELDALLRAHAAASRR